MHKLNKALYQLSILASFVVFCALVFFQYRDVSKSSTSQEHSGQLIDGLYLNLASYPALSSLLMAALGFFIISHVIFSLYEKRVFASRSDNQLIGEPAGHGQPQLSIAHTVRDEMVSMPMASSVTIFDAVIKTELSRLEDEVKKLKENANAIALTNSVIDNLIIRIETIIVDTQNNIDSFHLDLPAAHSLIKELNCLSTKANGLAKDIAFTIEKLLKKTESTTGEVNILINKVVLMPNESENPQVSRFLDDFDQASKLSNILALEQAELAQDVKIMLNQLSDIAKDTNLKSQCIVNSMRDISKTKENEEIKAAKQHD